jgi:hypothetical protein
MGQQCPERQSWHFVLACVLEKRSTTLWLEIPDLFYCMFASWKRNRDTFLFFFENTLRPKESILGKLNTGRYSIHCWQETPPGSPAWMKWWIVQLLRVRRRDSFDKSRILFWDRKYEESCPLSRVLILRFRYLILDEIMLDSFGHTPPIDQVPLISFSSSRLFFFSL